MGSGVPSHVLGRWDQPPEQPTPPPPARGTALRRWFEIHRSALVLVGLSILIPELLTGSTRVAALVNPVGDLFLLGLYGGGVLVIREVSVRWNRGWAPVLLLGAAYGIVEEGLGTKTFFDWAEIGRPDFGPYTHWLGVNWVWVGELTLFHAIFSIAMPIALTGLLFPGSRGQPLLTNRGLGGIFGAYLLTAGLMFLLFDKGYNLAPGPVAGCLVAIAALVLAAWKTPASWLRPRRESPSVRPRTEFLLGCGFVWGFFIVFLGLPGLLKNPFLTVGLGWCFSAACLLTLRATIGENANDAHVAFLTIGLLTFLVAFASLEEFLGDVFVFLAIAVVLWLTAHLYIRYRPEDSARLGRSARFIG